MERAALPLPAAQLLELLQGLPAGILVEDHVGRLTWINKTLESFLGRTQDSLLGRTAAELPLKRVPMGIGQPDLYEVLSSESHGVQWLTCTKWSIKSQENEYITVRCYLDATEHRRTQVIRNPLLASTQSIGASPLTAGILDRHGITQHLQSEVSRSRRYHNPLSIVLMRVHPDPTFVGNERDGDHWMSAAARIFKEHVRWADLVGRWSEWEFLLVLPETEARAAVHLVRKIQTHLKDEQALATEGISVVPMVHFGIGGWHQGDDLLMLLERAQSALKSRSQ